VATRPIYPGGQDFGPAPLALIAFQPRQPLPGIIDFGKAGIGVPPEVIKYRNQGLENIIDRPYFAEM